MTLIGLTGGIASGKSTVAGLLAKRGAVVIDADQIARDVVEPGTPGLAAVTRTFGDSVIANDGRLDRRALGALVFTDSAALARLNAIVHPLVRAEVARRIDEYTQDEVVVYDVPLLVEAAVDHPFDLIVVVEAPPAVRENRLVNLRGLTRDQAHARIQNQASDEARRAVADVVIDTRGSMADTVAQVDALWARLHGLDAR